MSSHEADVERRLRHDHHRQEHYDCDDRDRYDLEAANLDHPEHSLPPDINRTSEFSISSEAELYVLHISDLLSVSYILHHMMILVSCD